MPGSLFSFFFVIYKWAISIIISYSSPFWRHKGVHQHWIQKHYQPVDNTLHTQTDYK